MISVVVETRAAVFVELLHGKLHPSRKRSRAEYQQDIADDRSGERSFYHVVSPFDRPTRAMISSAALPNVALSSPPTPAPARLASCSVARPIHPAKGMIPKPDIKRALLRFSTRHIPDRKRYRDGEQYPVKRRLKEKPQTKPGGLATGSSSHKAELHIAVCLRNRGQQCLWFNFTAETLSSRSTSTGGGSSLTRCETP
jgi:hypothetical protein